MMTKKENDLLLQVDDLITGEGQVGLTNCWKTWNAKKLTRLALKSKSDWKNIDWGDIGVINWSLQHVTLSQWYITGQRAWVGGWQISRVSVLNYFIILMVIQRKCPGLLCRCQHYYNSWHFFLLLRQGRHRQQICVRSENLQLTAQYPVIVQCSTVV